MAVAGILIAAAIIGAVSAADPSFPSGSTTVTTHETSFSTVYSTSTRVSTSVSVSTSAIPKGTIVTQLADFLTLPVGVTNVYVTYSGIEIHTNGIGNLSTWLEASPAGAIDLTSVANQSITVGSAVVASGIYDAARLGITSAIVTYDARNVTAIVTSSEVSVRLPQGGIRLPMNGISGFVFDLAPTLVPSPNGNSTAMELVPFAKAVGIPGSVPANTYFKIGSALPIDSAAWFSSTNVDLQNNLTILLGLVTTNALTLVVNNTGTTPILLSQISILGPDIQNENTQTTTMQTVTELAPTANHTSSATTSMVAVAASVPSPFANLASNYQTVTSFLVLSNGSIVTSAQSAQTGILAGLVINPGQHVQFLFVGKIPTLNSLFSPNAPLSIVPGGRYVLEIVSPFGPSKDLLVTAVSPST